MTRRQIVIIIIIIAIPVIFGFILLLNPGFYTNQYPQLRSSIKRIGLVKVVDIIYTSDDYIRQLRELREDRSVAGVILRIDSPGGAVAPSQEIYSEIMRFRQAKKPIVVSMGNIAASGGYYIACSASKIFANPGTLTGSIGVIMQFPHYYELLNKIGVDVTTIKAGEFKDIGNPNRKLSDKERTFLQHLLDDTHEQFIQHISQGRNMDIEEIRQIADGRIFTGQQALNLGLVDSVGGFYEALSFLKDSLNLPEQTKVIEKRKGSGFFKDFIIDGIAQHIPLFNLLNNKSAGSYFLFEHL